MKQDNSETKYSYEQSEDTFFVRLGGFLKRNIVMVLLFAVIFSAGGALFAFYEGARVTVDKVSRDNMLNATVQQASQIIDNVRKAYTIHRNEKEISMERLIELGAIPESIVSDGEIKNLYGGDIIIMPSLVLENSRKFVESPTFKMSYRGLPHDVCVQLAMMNWGSKVEGLLAIATGSYDGSIDSALEEIDRIVPEEKLVGFTDKRGRHRLFRPRKRYRYMVASPDNNFLPSPFLRDNAETGCACSQSSDSCSFAWRYTVFAVDNPKKRVKELEDREKVLRDEILRKFNIPNG